MKEIWNKFKQDCQNALITCKLGIREMAKSTLEILKTGCIDFIKAIFTWLYSLGKGICLIIWSLIQIIWASLVASVKASIEYLYIKITEWIKKW